MALGFPEVIIILVFLAILAFVVRMFIHMIMDKSLSIPAKLLWGLAIIVIYPFGAIYYFFVRFNTKKP